MWVGSCMLFSTLPFNPHLTQRGERRLGVDRCRRSYVFVVMTSRLPVEYDALGLLVSPISCSIFPPLLDLKWLFPVFSTRLLCYYLLALLLTTRLLMELVSLSQLRTLGMR